MSWQTGIAIYFVVWWIALFTVLPWGVKRIDPADLNPGEDPGAPAKPRILLKFFATSVLSGVIFGIIYWIHESGLVTFRQ